MQCQRVLLGVIVVLCLHECVYGVEHRAVSHICKHKPLVYFLLLIRRVYLPDEDNNVVAAVVTYHRPLLILLKLLPFNSKIL